jgi:hypothetical protein
VRIAFAISESVMLPMARHPLLRHYRSRQPEPDTHGQLGKIVQLYTAMGLRAMQEQRDRHIGEMARDYYEQHRLPPSGRPASKIRHYKLQ